MITDSPRGARIAAALTKAQKEREAAIEKRFDEVKADPRHKEIEKRRGDLNWGTPAREAVDKEMDVFMQAELHSGIERRFPVIVRHTTYLCGSTRLPDGHEINAGSSWSVMNAKLPELSWTSFSGAEMHYILEHGQGRPERLELLEKLLELPPVLKVHGAAVGATVTRLSRFDWN